MSPEAESRARGYRFWKVRGGRTDPWGYVEFGGLDMLVARVSVEMSGYVMRTAPVALHPFRTAAVRVAMTAAEAPPQPIEVVVRTRAMDALSSNYVGRRGERAALFTRGMLEELAADRLSDALATLEGFRVERPRGRRAARGAQELHARRSGRRHREEAGLVEHRHCSGGWGGERGGRVAAAAWLRRRPDPDPAMRTRTIFDESPIYASRQEMNA